VPGGSRAPHWLPLVRLSTLCFILVGELLFDVGSFFWVYVPGVPIHILKEGFLPILYVVFRRVPVQPAKRFDLYLCTFDRIEPKTLPSINETGRDVRFFSGLWECRVCSFSLYTRLARSGRSSFLLILSCIGFFFRVSFWQEPWVFGLPGESLLKLRKVENRWSLSRFCERTVVNVQGEVGTTCNRLHPTDAANPTFFLRPSSRSPGFFHAPATTMLSRLRSHAGARSAMADLHFQRASNQAVPRRRLYCSNVHIGPIFNLPPLAEASRVL